MPPRTSPRCVARCPKLQVIATSRAPLKIGAETEFGLPPLDLPAAGATSLDALGRCPSVALFVQRAEKVKPGFALTEANAAPIAAICRRLDGLPLALELAAARVRILEPAALLQRLDHALDLLTSGDRDLPLRQRTLRATISWSYSLLDAQEQRLLRRLSCFHEGWTLEAMEQVCYGGDERHRALDELDSLVEKGLVRVVGDGRALRAARDDPRVRRRAAPRRRRGGEHAARACGLLRRVRGAGRLRPPRRRIRSRPCSAPTATTPTRTRRSSWLTTCARAGDAGALERALLLCGHQNWFWHISGQHLTARVALRDPAGARRRSSAEPRPRPLVARGRHGLDHDRRVGALARRVDRRLRGRRGRRRREDRGRGPDGRGLLQPEPRAHRSRGRGARRGHRTRRAGRRRSCRRCR